MVRICCAVLLLVLSCVERSPGGDPRAPFIESGKGTLQWTGNLRVDLVGQSILWDRPLPADSGVVALGGSEKSPWLAAGLSGLLPGAGEFYTGSYLKSAIFIAAEAAAVTIALIYNSKGNRQTDDFERYADAGDGWSVVRYGKYAASHMNPANPPYTWLIDSTGTRPPWESVNWSELNRMERDIGSYYSHTLPPHGEQQYYELIGKYHQFNQGWSDAPAVFNYGDPVTARFQEYSGMRGLANRYYRTSSTAVIVTVVNHLLSAADAAWSATRHNRELHAEARTMTIPTGSSYEVVPALSLSYRF
jgi:hypothetical protein